MHSGLATPVSFQREQAREKKQEGEKEIELEVYFREKKQKGEK